MKIFVIHILIGILSTFATFQIFADTPDPYVEALSNEAKKTKMQESKAAVTDGEREPAVVLDEPVDELAKKVSNQLEVILTGKSSKKLKQKQLAEVISTGVKEGRNIDEIHDIVRQAMTEFKKKKYLDIQPEVAEYAEKVVNDIVKNSKSLAQGDPNDPYIQGLTSEADGTTLMDREQNHDQNTRLNEEQHRTIVVLKGDSLFKIAKKIYGSGDKFILLFKANKDILKNPDLIEPGQVLNIPPLP